MAPTDKTTFVRSAMAGRIVGLGILILGLWSADEALADPLSTCRASGVEAGGVKACLERELAASHRTMEEALGRARAVAIDTDERTGSEYAVLAVEGSQNAWVAYRDTACETRRILLGGDDEMVELACSIELSQLRTAELLNLLAAE